MNKTSLRWVGDAPKYVANVWQESRRGPIAINAPNAFTQVIRTMPTMTDNGR